MWKTSELIVYLLIDVAYRCLSTMRTMRTISPPRELHGSKLDPTRNQELYLIDSKKRYASNFNRQQTSSQLASNFHTTCQLPVLKAITLEPYSSIIQLPVVFLVLDTQEELSR
ncbi:hypothetical protein O181_063609 [Austropuccinia psidii MF-1]|uniref:Uncharacterized protein n=1 Tax=Austropuccinia psidii MF-1 TaxID=1389203 RepID=A0A9Q3EMS5_9BASI|nr:hypothetical protein [Austropuccinia psidii MF-1]